MQRTESPEFRPYLTLATADSLDPWMQFSPGNTVLHTLWKKWEKRLNDFFSYVERIVKPSVKPFNINILEVFIIYEATVDDAFHKG